MPVDMAEGSDLRDPSSETEGSDMVKSFDQEISFAAGDQFLPLQTESEGNRTDLAKELSQESDFVVGNVLESQA
jgi:hypothetical protein